MTNMTIMTIDTCVERDKKKKKGETIEHKERYALSLGDRRGVHTHSRKLKQDEDERIEHISDEKVKQTFAHTTTSTRKNKPIQRRAESTDIDCRTFSSKKLE